MRRRTSVCIFYSKQEGFALAEVIVALFFVSMAIMLVGGLSQQVMNLSKSSKQTSAMIELRSKINALTRNADDWVHKMRVDPNIGSIYSGCIPDGSVVTTSFNCPAVDGSILAGDAELSRIAGPQMHAARVPIVDNMGEQIAGGDEPVYLNADGQPCTQEPKATQCAFESTGYMLRTNSASDSNPGNIRFVIKVARNIRNVASRGMAAMKPQYMSIDVGTQWAKTLTGSCPAGSLKMGYLSSGRPYCVKTMASCPSGQLALGINSSGAAICSSPPSSCPEGQAAAYDPSSETIKCTAATSSGCPAGKVFLGFYAGSQQAICMSADMSCPAGQVQVGFASSAGSVQASCAQVPTCSSSQVVAFNGNTFACSTESEGVLCAESQVLVGITKAGAPLCEPLVAGRDGVDGRNIAVGQTCDTGQFVAGINNDGTVVCRNPASATSDGNDDAIGFASMNQMPAFATGADNYEKQKHIWPLTCHVTNGTRTYQCGYFARRFKVAGANFNVATEITDNINDQNGSDSNFITSRRCIFIDGKWKMYSGDYRYNRHCTGGVMYKKMLPSATRLDMKPIGHPEHASEGASAGTGRRVAVTNGSMGAPSSRKPDLSEVKSYFNKCVASSTDDHCKAFNAALEKAKQYTAGVGTWGSDSQRLTPQFCQIWNGTIYKWSGCGVGCGVAVKVEYTPSAGYELRYRWAKNFVETQEGDRFPAVTICSGSSTATANARENRVRLAPAGLEDGEENLGDAPLGSGPSDE